MQLRGGGSIDGRSSVAMATHIPDLMSTVIDKKEMCIEDRYLREDSGP